MKNRRRNREAFAEHSYWQSYSDMMAALLLIFILLIAITLAIYRQKTSDLDQTRLALNAAQSELDATIEDLELSKAELEKSNGERASSLAELQQAYAQAALTQEELNNAYLEIENARQELTTTKQELQDIVGIRTMQVAAQTGSITFSSDVLFRYNSASLTAESRETLKNIIPMYLDVLLQDQFRGYIAEIIIEGHTDTDGGYQSNMELSYERANAVADFCLNKSNGLSEEKIEQLQKLLTVNGKSWSTPVYLKDAAGNPTGEVDMPASRRVEIKFRLKEDEMIKKIAGILAQDAK